MLEAATRVYVSPNISIIVYNKSIEIVDQLGSVSAYGEEIPALLCALEATAAALGIETREARLAKALEKLLAEAETGDQTWDTVRQARAALAEAK